MLEKKGGAGHRGVESGEEGERSRFQVKEELRSDDYQRVQELEEMVTLMFFITAVNSFCFLHHFCNRLRVFSSNCNPTTKLANQLR